MIVKTQHCGPWVINILLLSYRNVLFLVYAVIKKTNVSIFCYSTLHPYEVGGTFGHNESFEFCKMQGIS
jgi:hypothetical protein